MLNATKKLIVVSAVAASMAAPAAWSKTEEGKDVFKVVPSAASKPGEGLYSITARWRVDDALQYESSGLAFIKGPDMDKPDTPKSIAHKLVMGLKDGLVDQYPGWRGVLISEDQTADGAPAILVKNRGGFSFNSVTLRDYVNQTTRLESTGPSFSSGTMDKFAIDVVSAIAVESPMAASLGATRTHDSTDGAIEVTIGDGEPVRVMTNGKSLEAIEEELAGKINGAVVSSRSITPHPKNGDDRNAKPFDGGEIELTDLNTNAIQVSVTDPNLGVLYKFSFPDDNSSGTDVGILVPAGMIAVVLAYILYVRLGNRKQSDSDGQV